MDRLLPPPPPPPPVISMDTEPSCSGDARNVVERENEAEDSENSLTCEYCDKVFGVRISDSIRYSNFATSEPFG